MGQCGGFGTVESLTDEGVDRRIAPAPKDAAGHRGELLFVGAGSDGGRQHGGAGGVVAGHEGVAPQSGEPAQQGGAVAAGGLLDRCGDLFAGELQRLAQQLASAFREMVVDRPAW